MWGLVERQHGVVTRKQLLARGLSPAAVTHRIGTGRLHPVHRGVYAVGRPDLGQHGHWLAAVLAAGRGALLSHLSAAVLWGFHDAVRAGASSRINVTVPSARNPRVPDVTVHRRRNLMPDDIAEREQIPVTSVACTLVDLATQLPPSRLEAAVNAADRLNLIDPDALRETVERYRRRLGAPALRRLLDATTFALTDSELERLFLPIAREAGLPQPETGVRLHGYKLDFVWRELGLVVETDGLRYHRTATQQTRDRRRDQVLTAAGLTVLRFTHAQVAHAPDGVRKTLASVAARLSLTAAA